MSIIFLSGSFLLIVNPMEDSSKLNADGVFIYPNCPNEFIEGNKKLLIKKNMKVKFFNLISD